ncbi:MAG: serine O-acetyltransferase [Defluviitaleaceae bacterium]|nr:serine O-acetyltransferase [Defluviitaleaceae bacterium]
MIKKIAKMVRRRDPALRSDKEVLLYPGIWAIIFHRIAHSLYKGKMYFSARLVSTVARFLTGVEIHPGAQIGRGVFIDHGMGSVIGETSVVGDNVLIYHGVTLGATGKEQGEGRRHPVVGDNAIIGANAKVLGPITVGKNAKIGAGALVVQCVPEGATAVGHAARIIEPNSSQPVKPTVPAYNLPKS